MYVAQTAVITFNKPKRYPEWQIFKLNPLRCDWGINWLEGESHLFLTPAMYLLLQYSCETEGGARPPAFTQTALTERTESFVPKTKPNLCQTNELKRPTWEVNTNVETLAKYSAALVISLYLKIDPYGIC